MSAFRISPVRGSEICGPLAFSVVDGSQRITEWRTSSGLQVGSSFRSDRTGCRRSESRRFAGPKYAARWRSPWWTAASGSPSGAHPRGSRWGLPSDLIELDVGVQNLAGSRVRNMRPAGVLRGGRQPADHRVAHILGAPGGVFLPI